MKRSSDAILLTKRSVELLPAPDKGSQDYWDAEIPGLHVRVWASGKRSYRLKYRAGGRQRVISLGEHGSITADQARKAAQVHRSAIVQHRDPLAERAEAQQRADEARRKAITVRQLVERWLVEGRSANPSKRESSWLTDERKLRRHILPLLGETSIQALTSHDISEAQAKIVLGETAADEKTGPRGRAIVTGGPGIARSAVMSLSSCLGWACSQKLLADNPCRWVKKEKPRKKNRYLSEHEVSDLLGALTEMQATGDLRPAFGDIIRLLLLTGARKSEIQNLDWREVSLERALITLPRERSKTGEKTIPLSAPAAAILAERQLQSDYVLGLHDLPPKPLRQLRALFRQHGLRHSDRQRTQKPNAELVARIDLAVRDKPIRPLFVDALRLAALTGMSLEQVRNLRWKDRARSTELTGAPNDLLSPDTRGFLEALRKRPRPVFPSPLDSAKPIEGLQKAWERIRERAGLSDTRLHDLRHSFASFAAAEGASLLIIGKVLGHVQASTTQRYAHLGASPARDVVDLVARTITRVSVQKATT